MTQQADMKNYEDEQREVRGCLYFDEVSSYQDGRYAPTVSYNPEPDT